MLSEVHVTPMSLDGFAGVARARQLRETILLAEELRSRLAGRVVWNVNSTAAGGGVAEMLHRLVGYARGAGFDSRWLVIAGDAEFFRITKRVHNALHGESGDGSPLNAAASQKYEQILRANARELCSHIRRGDIVFLHDPQTAGLVPLLLDHGAAIVWRCHVGADERNAQDELAWTFLRPYLERVKCCVFTRAQYVPEYLREKSVIIPPNIDPLAPKNQPMTAATARSILNHTGIVSGSPGRGRRTFRRTDGTPTRVESRAAVLSAERPPPWDQPLVVQVSRWDRLKDPSGVMRGFAGFLSEPVSRGVELVLAGPDSSAVADDPEGVEVFNEVRAGWERLPGDVRGRVHLVSLPMVDMEENAAIVNALQRHAAVVVQKSLKEGFGLTVTEAMWKARPVVGSAVGGIQDQITDRVTGLLVDPTSDEAFRRALVWMFEDGKRATTVGRRARERVREEYLGIRSLLRWGALLTGLIDNGHIG